MATRRALDGAVPDGCPEPRRWPQSVQKIALVLEKAPKKLQPDLVALVPKLVDGSEHSLAACALLNHLQKPDAEPSLRLPVFGALSELEFESDVWKQASFQAFELFFLKRQAFELLADSNDEPLVAAITYVLKAASQCQHIAQAARAVRWRLKGLGTEVPHCRAVDIDMEIENQLEWVRSEKDEQIAKLSADKKNIYDRVHEAETQLSQFKARKREELKYATSRYVHVLQGQLLDDETRALQVELTNLLDVVQETEIKMMEMSALNHLMSTHVLQQAQQILRQRRYPRYSVKVTFLELYNEEITDLLAPEEISKVALEER